MQAVHTPEHVTGRKHARWAACLPEASNATVTRPKSGRLRGRRCCGWARVHPFSPAPYRIVPASAFCALLPWATVSVIKIKQKYVGKKKKGMAVHCARFGPVFSSLLQQLSCSFRGIDGCCLISECNRTWPAGLHYCFRSIPLRGGGIPSPSFLPAGLWTSRFPHSLWRYATQAQRWFNIQTLLSPPAPIPYSPVYFPTKLLKEKCN